MSFLRFYLLIFVFIFFSLNNIKAQFTDDFSDGDFTNSPEWITNDAILWQVDAGELRSNSSDEATYYISTESTVAANAIWQFQINLKFATSGVNYVDAYLMSDNSELSDVNNGYFVRIGDTQDEIVLYKIEGGVETALIDNAEGIINSSSDNPFIIKVTKDVSSNWTLEYDDGITGSFISAGSTIDNSVELSSYFGFLVVQSSATAPKMNHFFDDISVSGTIAPDTSPPNINQIEVIAESQLELKFSEDLDQATAENPANYLVDNNIGAPTSSTLDTTDPSLVYLTFSNAFENATDYQLTVNNVEDLNGNAITEEVESFFYFTDEPVENKDVIINEIMAAPQPEQTLPDAEYIELFNRSSKTFNLEDWMLSDQSNTAVLPSYFLSPGEYLILTSTSNASAFSAYGEVLAISNFPTLNNNGDQLALHAASGILIDTITYTNDWYNDSEKAADAYSLELIDPNNFCDEQENWTASIANDKGTPGSQNSAFDDQFDTTPPFIESATAVSLSEITITFNQRLDVGSVDAADFSVDRGITISNVIVLSDNPEIVQLELAANLEANVVYELSVTGLSDCSGNFIASPESAEVIFVEGAAPDFKDLVINEILADPDPRNDLPAEEFIELFNRSDKIFDLENWTFSDQSSTAILPKTVLFPGEYLILCPAGAAEEFEPFGPAMGVSNWPSLNNSGDVLTIRDNLGNAVDSVMYNSTWYNSSLKQEGGWTLELIDPENECGEEENWTASENLTGGTPGMQNSVLSQNPDLSGPRLEQVLALKADSVVLRFNEKLDLGSIATASYSIVPDVSINNKVVASSLREIILNTSSISSGQQYTMTVNNLADCSGNLIDVEFKSLQFSLIEKPGVLDVVVNEVLFNPKSGGTDFVELYNRSQKFLNLKGWKIANGSIEEDSLILDSEDIIIENDFLLAPGGFLALTEDKLVLIEQYPLGKEEQILEVTDLPSFSNDEGLVAIKDTDDIVLDFFLYSEDYHSPLLDDVDGVALERVSSEEKTNLSDNWKSATATVGFATPGYENSQSRENITTVEGEITIEPTVIVPDGSGRNDFTTINYRFSSPGNVATVRVFDVQGRLIKEVANNMFLSSEGFFTWDGTDESGRKVRTGYYLVLFEIFDASGNTETMKEKVAVGSRF